MAKTDWTMNDTVMPEDMNELGAEVNAKVNHSLADATYYVNASTGSDTNDGLSAEKALKTIGAAIAKVPQVINHIVNIIVADGLYDEVVNLAGYTGKGSMTVKSTRTKERSDACKVKQVIIENSSASINVIGLCLTHATETALQVYGSSSTWGGDLLINEPSSADGVRVEYGSSLYLYRSEISNRDIGVRVRVNARLLMTSCFGTGNSYGMRAEYGGYIFPDPKTNIGGINGQYQSLFGGQVVYGPLTATYGNLNIYVSPSGNDSNDGSSAAPLQTIQAAIKRIPQVVNHTVTINLAQGFYSETVNLFGFVGSGKIMLLGAANNIDAFAYRVHRINIQKNSCIVEVSGIEAIATSEVAFHIAENAMLIVLTNCRCVLASSHQGINVWDSAAVRIRDSIITNRNAAIFAQNSRVSTQRMSGSGNQIGLSVHYAGVIGTDGTQPAGATAQITSSGGVIR